MISLKRCSVSIVAMAVMAVIAVMGQTLQASGAAAKTTSKYVALDLEKCTQTLTPDPNDDFQDYGEWRCGSPVLGWSVNISYSDLRMTIDLSRNGVTYPLDFSAKVSGRFMSLGSQFEFRIRNGRPIGSVVRAIHEDGDGDGDGATKSVLVVSRFRPSPCVIAVVNPGATQSANARKLADTAEGKPCKPNEG
jgi:hypothetical protein